MGRVKVDRSKAQALVRRAGLENLREEGRKLLKLCQDECPVQTGFLRASHRMEGAGVFEVRIVAHARYARNVYDGDGPGGRRRPNRWFQRAIDRARIS
jgi:hypothetical protein